MAEAVVEDRPQPPQRFYCHVCSVEVQSVNSDFTCPICSGGFIEELPATADAPSDDVEMTDANGLNDLDMIRDEIATLFRSRTGSRPPDSDGGPEDDPTTVGIVGANGGAGGSVTVLGRGGRRNRRRLRMQNFDRFDNILLEILQTLSGGNEAALGNASMFFMGNPGDYAWGREGIDTIVTQLLNQMDTTGPPPLPKEKIDEIPNVDITEEQVEHKLQCSVCWEDFKLNEPVRKLPCLHVYHENCIIPWLELHGTCPICRKSLTPDVPDVTNSLRNVTSFIRGVPDDHQQQQQYQSGSTVDTSFNGTPSTNTTSSHQQDSQLIDDDIFNSPINIPMSLSRILSQPGTSQQLLHHPLSTSASSGLVFPPATTTTFLNQQRQQPNNDMDIDCDRDGNHRADGGGGGSGGTSSGTNTTGTSGRSTRTTQNDVFKYDDGNIEYDFD